MWAFMKGKRMSDVSNAPVPVATVPVPPVAAVAPVPPVSRVATPAEKSVFGPNVKFDATGNPIEAGIGALIADVKEAVQKVEDFVAKLEPTKTGSASATPINLVTAPPVTPTAATTSTPSTAPSAPPAPMTPTTPMATAAGVAAVKAAIATAPRANRADMIAKLKALEAELAASAD